MSKSTGKTKNEIQLLEEENRLMEERLRLMREMMVLEKQKREANNTSTWTAKIAKQETKKREPSKQQASKSPSHTSLPTSQSKQPAVKASSSTTPKLSPSASSSATPKLLSSTSSSATTKLTPSTSPPPKKETGGERKGQINNNEYDEEASHQSFLGALEEWRRGGDSIKTNSSTKKSLASSTSSTSALLSSSSSTSLAKQHSYREGRSEVTATDAEFNEKESHQSFLEALEEWRSGGKEQNSRPSTAHSIGTTTETSTATHRVTLTLNGNSSWGAAIAENITSIPSSSYFANM